MHVFQVLLTRHFQQKRAYACTEAEKGVLANGFSGLYVCLSPMLIPAVVPACTAAQPLSSSIS